MIITEPDTTETSDTQETSNPGSVHTDNDGCQPWDGSREE